MQQNGNYKTAKALTRIPAIGFAVIAAAFIIAMLLISIFSWKISTITLLLCAAAVSLAVFLFTDARKGKEGEKQ